MGIELECWGLTDALATQDEDDRSQAVFPRGLSFLLVDLARVVADWRLAEPCLPHTQRVA